MIAALLLPFALLQADAAVSPTAVAQTRFERCVAMIDADAAAAYEEGMRFASEGQQIGGYRCAAMALIAQNRHAEGARRLDSLAMGLNPASVNLKAELFSQAGNAWLLAREPGQARAAFSHAIDSLTRDNPQMPDLLIDRARAYAMEADYRHAEEDLSGALDLRPQDSLALRLRASARLRQNSFQLAEADAQAALTAAQTEEDRVGAALMLGHVRESIRTGVAVDEQ
jgi:tetratricopeptide (TPR) repeat protein